MAPVPRYHAERFDAPTTSTQAVSIRIDIAPRRHRVLSMPTDSQWQLSALTRKATRKALAQVIERRISDIGGALTVPAERMATLLLALFQGLVAQRRTDPDSVPDDMFPLAVRWMFAGVITPAPAPPQVGDAATDAHAED
ncbi:hypothetical protein [Streptomyces sp. NPDC005408]|uniref:hypothetical protein n=1 Tax=Streptomyces sp. NPDC005408 TaxID=3155341 RepID=UPI0033A2BB12